MKQNSIKQLWKHNKPVINGWLSIANAFTAEIMAEQGYDSLTIDLQHGIVDYQAAVGMLQAMRASDVTPLARVPWLDPAAIMKALDAGAYGVICPMINTRAQAEELVSYMRYPPVGTRSDTVDDDVWRPRPVTALTTPVARSVPGTRAFTSVDLPTPEWPTATVVWPARSGASSSTGQLPCALSTTGMSSAVKFARNGPGSARSVFVTTRSGWMPAS